MVVVPVESYLSSFLFFFFLQSQIWVCGVFCAIWFQFHIWVCGIFGVI